MTTQTASAILPESVGSANTAAEYKAFLAAQRSRSAHDELYFQAVAYERVCYDASRMAATNQLAWEWRMIAQRWGHRADRLMSEGVWS